MKSVPFVTCLYSGADRMEFEVEICQARTRATEKLTLSPAAKGNFKTLERFCERHGLDVRDFIQKLSSASEEPTLSILGGGA